MLFVRASNRELESVQAHCAVASADRCGDKSDPADLAKSMGTNFYINGEPPTVRDSKCAQPLHLGS